LRVTKFDAPHLLKVSRLKLDPGTKAGRLRFRVGFFWGRVCDGKILRTGRVWE